MSGLGILRDMFPFTGLSVDLKLVSVSNMIGAFGDGLFVYMLPIYIRNLGATPVHVGVLFTILSVSEALTIIPGGFIADRFDRKKVMILGWFIWLPFPLLFCIATDWSQLILPMILYGVFLSGPARSAYVAAKANKGEITLTFTTISSSWSLGYFLSPMVGGYLSTTMGTQWIFFLGFFFYAIATSVLFFIRPQQAADIAKSKEIAAKPDVSDARRIVFLSMFFGVATFFLSSVHPLVVQLVQDVSGLDKSQVGVLGSITFFGQVVFLTALGKIGDRWTKMVAVATSLLLSSLSFGLLICFSNFPLLALACFLSGASFSIWSLMDACTGSIAPAGSRGRWISLSQTILCMTAFGGPYLGGVLYEASTYLPFFMVIAVGPLLSLLAILVDRSNGRTRIESQNAGC